MKLYEDIDVKVRVEYLSITSDISTQRNSNSPRVRIHNLARADQVPLELTIQQFQRIMAFGEFLLHPKY